MKKFNSRFIDFFQFDKIYKISIPLSQFNEDLLDNQEKFETLLNSFMFSNDGETWHKIDSVKKEIVPVIESNLSPKNINDLKEVFNSENINELTNTFSSIFGAAFDLGNSEEIVVIDFDEDFFKKGENGENKFFFAYDDSDDSDDLKIKEFNLYTKEKNSDKKSKYLLSIEKFNNETYNVDYKLKFIENINENENIIGDSSEGILFQETDPELLFM